MASFAQRVLVIIPGWGGDASSWKKFTDRAQKSGEYVDVEVIELPCFGAKSCPESVWDVPEYATYVQQEIHRIKNKHAHAKIVVLGHSFGGQVLTYMLGHNGQAGVDAVVLSGAAIIRPKKFVRRALGKAASFFAKVLLSFTSKKIANNIRYKLYRVIGSPDYTNAKGMKQKIFLRVIRFDVQHMLAQITLPTLVVWGSADRYTPLRHGKRIHSKIKDATMHIFDGATHGIHIKMPQELHERIQQFLRTL
ncbi:MAG: alpha/beta hydrolase [Candidatus Magasanikbacteria bacterium]|jgi:pimeloyl-ACP methyl ester carboxylesterase|nr:alpha/beta hydrolase [Candidatus Magasanikbacteria bacterium]